MWGIICGANDTQVVVGPFANYDNATNWAKAFSNPDIECKIVPFSSPHDNPNKPERRTGK